MGKVDKINWSIDSEKDLNQIYKHYLEFAPETALDRIVNILNAVEEVIYTDQWQVDEFDSKSRRIIVDKRFRVLYRKTEDGILIVRVHPAKKDPDSFKSK